MLNIFWGFKEYPQRCPLICLLFFFFFFGTLRMIMTKGFKNLVKTSEIGDEIKGAAKVPYVLSVDFICPSAIRTLSDDYGRVLL